MNVTIQTYDLVSALATVSRAISPRPVNRAMEGVLMTAGDNSVTFTASDGSMTIRTEASAFVTEPGSAVIPCKLLGELAKKLPADTVDIEVAGNTAKIRSGKSRTNMAVYDANEYPDIGTYETRNSFTIPGARFRDMIGSVIFSVCPDSSRLILTGVNIDVEDGTLRLVALDGFRLSTSTDTGVYPGKYSVVVPGATMTELSKILPPDETPCTVDIADSRITVSYGSTVVSSVLLSGDYIDYRKIIPDTFPMDVLVSKADMQTAIDRACIIARNGRNNLIRLDISKDSVHLSSRDENGQFDEDVSADVAGGNLSISFNAKYLTDVFRAVTNSEVVMHFNDGTKPCVITPRSDQKENPNYLYLVLPVRVTA